MLRKLHIVILRSAALSLIWCMRSTLQIVQAPDAKLAMEDVPCQVCRAIGSMHGQLANGGLYKPSLVYSPYAQFATC